MLYSISNNTIPVKKLQFDRYQGWKKLFPDFKEPNAKRANFLIIGTIMDDLDDHAMGEILYVADEFTAHRLVKEINKSPDNCVWVKPISKNCLTKAKITVHNFIKRF